MIVEQTTLEGVMVVTPEVFEDHRGVYVETYNRQAYLQAGIDCEFLQDDYSRSSRFVLRGLHGDRETWKLVHCPFGRLMVAVVDCRKNKDSFGIWETFVISARNAKQVLIPPSFANGHLVLSHEGIFAYKQSTYYAPEKQFSYRWDDPVFSIHWPIKTPILSQRDTVINIV